MGIISAIVNFYWSHAIPLQKLSNERSYKFIWILTLTKLISIRNLKFFARLKKWRPLNSGNAAEPKRHIKKLFATTDDRRRQMKLRSNTHGCELITTHLHRNLWKSFGIHVNLNSRSIINWKIKTILIFV